MTLSARQIQHAMFVKRLATSQIILPCYAPRNWSECDLFLVTKAGLFWEFEIKLTLSDYRADTQKRLRWRYHHHPGSRCDRHDMPLKHDLLRAHDPQGPSCFWFITPADLVGAQDVPEWAGLLWASEWSQWGHAGISLKVRKKAPRLHGQRCATDVLEHARSVIYYRYWSEIGRSCKKEQKDAHRPEEAIAC